MKNKLDYTTVELKPYHNEYGRTHTGHCCDIANIFKAWNESKKSK